MLGLMLRAFILLICLNPCGKDFTSSTPVALRAYQWRRQFTLNGLLEVEIPGLREQIGYCICWHVPPPSACRHSSSGTHVPDGSGHFQ